MAVAEKLVALRIKANLIADKEVGLLDINVDVHCGVAVLSGEVYSAEQKRIAEELAYQIEGVFEVENELQVIESSLEQVLLCECEDAHLGYGPAEGDIGDTVFSISGAHYAPGPGLATSEQFPGQFTDEDVICEVRTKLGGQDEIDVSRVKIDCANQIAHLRGVVKTSEDLNRLYDMVLNVRGVMGVSSDVSVEQGDVGTPTSEQ